MKNLYIIVSGNNGSTESTAYSYITKAAEHIGKHPNTIRNWVREGKRRVDLPGGEILLIASWIRDKKVV